MESAYERFDFCHLVVPNPPILICLQAVDKFKTCEFRIRDKSLEDVSFYWAFTQDSQQGLQACHREEVECCLRLIEDHSSGLYEYLRV